LTLFAFGARHLKMSTLGMLQYVAPSLVFIMSLFYGEKFDMHQAVTFGLIWGGLALYSWAEFAPKKAAV
jgi:chloramphenicol-sensitive protein RarD